MSTGYCKSAFALLRTFFSGKSLLTERMKLFSGFADMPVVEFGMSCGVLDQKTETAAGVREMVVTGFGIQILAIVELHDVAQRGVNQALPLHALAPVVWTVFLRSEVENTGFFEQSRGGN